MMKRVLIALALLAALGGAGLALTHRTNYWTSCTACQGDPDWITWLENRCYEDRPPGCEQVRRAWARLHGHA